MSSTTGVQNYLSNVFRPVYSYDPLTTLYTPKLELSNIDSYSGNTVSVKTIAIGDANNNVYVGSNAGNLFNSLQGNSNVTAIGYAAGSNTSNVINSVYLGSNAGSGAIGANTVIGIGVNAGGAGTSNIFIGNDTKSTGSSNILLGHGIDLGPANNQFRIGLGSNITVAGNLSNKWIGIGGITAPTTLSNRFDVNGNSQFTGSVGINIAPGTRTLDVNGNFRAQSAPSILDFFTTTTPAYANPNQTILVLSNTAINGYLNTFMMIGSNYATPAYNLDVYGTGRFASIYGTTIISNGNVQSPTVQATSGYYSLKGTTAALNGTPSNVAVIQKGLTVVVATNGVHYHAVNIIALSSSSGFLTSIGSNQAIITVSGANIQMADAGGGVYTWNVTYYPTP
jgi:hypothetical protein